MLYVITIITSIIIIMIAVCLVVEVVLTCFPF